MSTCEFEVFVILIGNGANGKSVLLFVISALAGKQNVAAVQPSQFDRLFQRAHLHGKLANIVTEMAEGAQIQDAPLKAITSSELTTAEHKFKDPFEFHPFGTCWFGTNHMPNTRDYSDAVFRRAKIVTFNNRFGDSRCDPHLKDKLAKELPGILNLALEAFAGVLQRGTFTTCPSNEQAKAEWRAETDHVKQFIEDRCVLDRNAAVPSGTLWDEYQRWAKQENIEKKCTRQAFGSRLKRLGLGFNRTISSAPKHPWMGSRSIRDQLTRDGTPSAATGSAG